MYRLMLQQFVRTRTCQLGLTFILILAVISLLTGRQFLQLHEQNVSQATETQQEHVARNLAYHGDDIGLLLYYLKFSLVNEVSPLAALSIGQKDINPNVQRVSMLTLTGQKYDTDIVNPVKLLFGNLDFSFLLIFVFPLVIIAFCYNLLSDEKESGTWSMVRVMYRSDFRFLLTKLWVRISLLWALLTLVFAAGAIALSIPFIATFLILYMASVLYLFFWFAVSFWVICLQRNSSFNALLLLSSWLVLVVILPSMANSAITTRYPVPEALSTMIEQRDGYHQKWDEEKRESMVSFYETYPQFESYGFPSEKGFNWFWYYAIQFLGDKESQADREQMNKKILKREAVSRQWASVVPPMHLQLFFNDLSGTSLINHLAFLSHIDTFHEETRVFFYPEIYANTAANEVDWDRFQPQVYTNEKASVDRLKGLIPLLFGIAVFIGLTALFSRPLRRI